MDLLCKNCKHFRHHYIKWGDEYRELHYGHCVYPRLKKRENNIKGCEHFAEKTKENDAE